MVPACQHAYTPNCPGGKCVCYMEERTEEQEQLFRKIIDQKMNPPKGAQPDYDFSGYVFVHGNSDNYRPFCGASFGEAASFRGATIGGSLDFDKATFSSHADFAYATFDGYACFTSVSFMKGASHVDATFRSDALFGYTIFNDSHMPGRESALFMGATFSERAWFQNAGFRGGASFSRVTFHAGADLRGAEFDGSAEFDGATSPDKHAVEVDGIKTVVGRAGSLYRLAKQSHQDSGEYMLAGDYHYLERVHAWHSKWQALPETTGSQWRHVSLLLEYAVGRLVFGYGEKPWRPFIAGMVVIFLWAWLFMLTGIEVGDQTICRLLCPSLSPRDWWGTACDFSHSLYFSIVTFSTLGYGDIAPASVASKALANAESLIGLVLVAAFAVCLAKRFARG